MAKAMRTKVLKGGVRARVAKPGETPEQKKAWQDKLVQRGIPSMVFSSQSQLDEYCYRLKAMQKREALRDRLERQYRAGELVSTVTQRHAE